MSEIGENIYDTTEDDLNQIQSGIKDTKNAYDKGRDLYDSAKDLYERMTNAQAEAAEATSGTNAAAEGVAGAEVAAGAAGGTGTGAGAGAAAGAEAGGAAAGAETGGTAAGATAVAGGGTTAAEGTAIGALLTVAAPVLIIVGIVVGGLLLFLVLFAYIQALSQASSGRKYAETTLNQQVTHNDSGTFEEGNNDDKPDDDPDYTDLYKFYGGSPYLKGYFQFIPFLKGTEKTVEDAAGSEVLEGTIKAMKEEKDFPTTAGAFEKAKKLALLDAQEWVNSYKSMSGLMHDCIHDKSSGSVSEGDHCAHGEIDEYDRFDNKMECDGWTSEASKEVMEQVEAAVETLFDDVDYAELLCVLGENEDYDIDNMTEENFRAIFMGKKSTRTSVLRQYYYLEIRVEHNKYTVYETQTSYNENGEATQETIPVAERYKDVGHVTLERYNLDELYVICSQKQAYEAWYTHEDFNPESEYYLGKTVYHKDKEPSKMNNKEFLNWQEPRTRQYGAYGSGTSGGNHIDTTTQNKLFGETNRSARGESGNEIRPRQKFNIADFKYWVNGSDSDDVTVEDKTETEIIYGNLDVNVAHGEIGAEIGDITQVARSVAQAFLRNNPNSPYSITETSTFLLPWGTYTVYPCCASGTTLVAKYFGLKSDVVSYTGAVANSNYSGSNCNISSLSELRVGDILTYGNTHTEIVTKIDGDKVYIAGFGSNTNIIKDAQQGYNKTKDKTSALSTLAFNSSGTPQVWRPNESTFNFNTD